MDMFLDDIGMCPDQRRERREKRLRGKIEAARRKALFQLRAQAEYWEFMENAQLPAELEDSIQRAFIPKKRQVQPLPPEDELVFNDLLPVIEGKVIEAEEINYEQ
jgi:hypothetical protein